MVSLLRSKRWLLWSLVLIVGPAALLAGMSWRYLHRVEELLLEDRRQEILERSLELQSQEQLWLKAIRRNLDSVTGPGESASEDVEGWTIGALQLDANLNVIAETDHPAWERIPGRELSSLMGVAPTDKAVLSTLWQLKNFGDPDREITRRLLMARSLRARGMWNHAMKAFRELSRRYPRREESVMSLVASLEMARRIPDPRAEARTVTLLENVMSTGDWRPGLHAFVINHLIQLEEGRGSARIARVRKRLEARGTPERSRRAILIDALALVRDDVHAALANKQDIVRGGDHIWILAVKENGGPAVAVIERDRWAARLRDWWAEQSGTFMLTLDIVEEAGEPGVDIEYVRLAVPGLHARVALDPRDRVSDLLSRQTRTGTWGTAFLVLVLALGTTLAIGATLKAQKVSRLKSEFVSTVSHELRTPLTSIQMFVETLKSNRVTDEADRENAWGIIETETVRLKRLIERLLSFSALEKGQPRLNLEDVALQKICRHAAGLVQPQFQEAGMILNADIPTDEIEIRGDSNALIEIIINLLTNALKYAREGEAVDLQLRSGDEHCVILVQDRGPGVPKGDRQRLFEPFERGPEDMARAIEGAGLGLALVRQLARLHGGDVTVHDREGGGAEFRVRLPARQNEGEQEV